MAYEYAEHCPEGDGGNSTLTNQDERMILDATATVLPVRVEGAQDAEFH